MSALISLAIIAGWAICGTVGYYLTRWWWTAQYDWTTEEHVRGIAWALTGPANVIIGLFLAVPAWLDERTGDYVLKERRR